MDRLRKIDEKPDKSANYGIWIRDGNEHDWPNLMQSHLGLILFVAIRRKFSHVVPSMNNCIWETGYAPFGRDLH